MRTQFGRAIVLALTIPLVGQLAAAQTAYKPARLADGKPNLNGIWQALNTANWDLRDHASGPSLVVAMGAIGAEPGGMGVVEGGEIPYLPAALEARKANF